MEKKEMTPGSTVPLQAGTPVKCPRCDGQGHTWKPPHVAGDQQEWLSTDMKTHSCPPCNGTGILWINPAALVVPAPAPQAPPIPERSELGIDLRHTAQYVVNYWRGVGDLGFGPCIDMLAESLAAPAPQADALREGDAWEKWWTDWIGRNDKPIYPSASCAAYAAWLARAALTSPKAPEPMPPWEVIDWEEKGTGVLLCPPGKDGEHAQWFDPRTEKTVAGEKPLDGSAGGLPGSQGSPSEGK